MGCFDIYCLLCGNSCHSSKIDKESLFEEIQYYKKNYANSKSIKHKWIHAKFNNIYKIYNNNPQIIIQKINHINKITKWLDKCTFLSADNKINHGCKEIACNTVFKDKKGNCYYNETVLIDNIMYGTFVHTDCWKFIKEKYGISLTYSHIPIIQIKQINYGIIQNYWDQFFDFVKIISDDNINLVTSPLKSKLLAKNITKIITKLKIKNNPNRKAPIVSATFYESGMYKIGINGNIWIVKNGKWNEIKETIKIKTIDNIDNIQKKAVFYADVNKYPLFILKQNINKKTIELEILTIKTYM